MLADLFASLRAGIAYPLWGIFLLMIISIIKTYPIIQKNLLDARDKRENRYSERIRELEAAVHACQKECEEHKTELRKQLDGLRRQNIQDQISLVSVLVQGTDNPALKKVLETLQSVQRALPVEELPGVAGDTR